SGILDLVHQDGAKHGATGIADGDAGIIDRAVLDVLHLDTGGGRSADIGGGEAKAAEIDQVLIGRRAARGVEADDTVIAEASGVIDDAVETAAHIDDVVASAADDGVIIVAAIERV